MTDNRKQIRVTLPADMVPAFKDAKRQAEQSAMLKMTDTQYATRLLCWALEQNR